MAHNMMGVLTYEIGVLIQVYVECNTIPSEITVVQGDDVQLSCRASGVPTPSITWYRKGGGPMPRQYNITGGDLQIYNISKEEEGTFVCLATNVLGSKTAEATIVVNVFPKIASFLDQPITINESQTLIFPCNATGHPIPKISWSKINASLPEGRYVHDSQMLNISGVKYEDRGEYVCTANNTVGTAVKKTTVIVQVAPKIKKRPNATEYGYRGKSKTLSLEIFAVPAAKVTWTKPNKGEISGRFQQMNDSLFVENMKYTDSGHYQATATNVLGKVKVTTFLFVRDTVPATIRSWTLQKRISIQEGRNLTESCLAVGVPTPEMVWRHRGKIVRHATTRNLQLNLFNIGNEHSGRYTCRATNEFGYEERHLDLTVIQSIVNRGEPPINYGLGWIRIRAHDRIYSYNRFSGSSYSTTGQSTEQLMSPSYPSQYPRSLKYYWKLTSNAKIKIFFQKFDTESCCDKLRIYDGNSTSSHLLGEFSGNTLPPNITSSSAALYLEFTTDGPKERPGFLVGYKAVG